MFGRNSMRNRRTLLAMTSLMAMTIAGCEAYFTMPQRLDAEFRKKDRERLQRSLTDDKIKALSDSELCCMCHAFKNEYAEDARFKIKFNEDKRFNAEAWRRNLFDANDL